MTLNARLIRRSMSRVVVALLPIALAGCSFLFPQRGGMGGSVPAGSSSPGISASPAPSGMPAPGSTPSAPAASLRPTSKKANATLYDRLGGDGGINAFTDDFLGRVTNDPAIIPFFKGLTDADLKRIRQHVFELLCSATGGPCTYTGKDMKTTHKEMEINNASWNAFTGHLNESVSRFRIQDRERNELVVIIASLKGDIVNR